MVKFFALKKHLAKEVGIFLAIFSGVGAIALALVIKFYPNDIFDLLVSREVQESNSHRLLALMQFVSLFGVPYVALVMTAIVVLIFLLFGHKREAVFMALTPLAAVLNSLLKIIIDRARPTSTLIIVYQQLTDPSFPSGHVVYYVVFFGFLITTMFAMKEIPAILRVSVVTISVILIGLVSISRVYLGVHWATDVLEGYFIGYLLLFALSYWYLNKTPGTLARAGVGKGE